MVVADDDFYDVRHFIPCTEFCTPNYLSRFGIEGPVYLAPRNDKGGGEWLVDEQQQKVKKTDGSISFGVLQTVRIHMEVVEPQPNRPKLQLTLN